MNVFTRAVLVAAAIAGLAGGIGVTAASASPAGGIGDTAASASSLPPSAWDAGIKQAVRADVAASGSLPDGNQVYVFGDTLAVNGQVICSPTSCPFGFPHDSVAIEKPGSAAFTMQSCSALGCPYGWQWVPNWSDGTEFWMAAPLAYGNKLYVIGARVSTSGSACSYGCIEGEYVAKFAIGSGDSLTYDGVTQLTGEAGETDWGSVVLDSSAGGWWLTGTRATGGSKCFCKTMDVAFVPFPAGGNSTKWTVTQNVLPSGQGWDLGTVTSLAYVSGSGWVIFTKQNDIIGSAIEELNSSQVTSGWSVTGTYPVTTANGCTETYAAEAHPEDGAPAGEMLVSWASNGNASGQVCAYVPQFTYLPINQP